MNLDNRQSISSDTLFVNGIPNAFLSVTQTFVMLSLTEAEIAADMMVAQEMLYLCRLLELLRLAHVVRDGQLRGSRNSQ